MRTSQPLVRAPRDMTCPMLEIAEGCTYGKCRFCGIYRNFPFKLYPMGQVARNIDEIARKATLMTRRIYLAGGNPFGLPTERLIEVFDAVEERIPQVNSYGGFCRVLDLKGKSDAELRLLAERGVNDLDIGAESGLDSVLEFIEKGHTAADVVEQGQRLYDAGMDFTYFYLAGMAGAGRGIENAIASAEVFSKAAPTTILVVCLAPVKTWPLAEDIDAGRWVAPTELEMAQEIRAFVEHLDCKTTVNCSHDSDVIRFEGGLPGDKEKMLALLDDRIPKIDERYARMMREMLHGGTFEKSARA